MFKRRSGSSGERPDARRVALGSLSQCMVDADSESLARARTLRSRALAVSIALEVFVVAALLIWPLIAAPGALPPVYVTTPVPPYHGGGSAEKPRLHRRAVQPTRPLLPDVLTFPTVRTRAAARQMNGESAPRVPGDISDAGIGGGGPVTPWITGATGSGMPIQPPRPPAPVKPLVHRSEGVMQGQLVRQVQPLYPEIARDMHLSGTVRLEAIIGTDGTVRSLNLLSGNPILARAAVDAVHQWRYRPTLLNGAPVEVETYITVNFVLSQ